MRLFEDAVDHGFIGRQTISDGSVQVRSIGSMKGQPFMLHELLRPCLFQVLAKEVQGSLPR